jgi:hypothetical protein
MASSIAPSRTSVTRAIPSGTSNDVRSEIAASAGIPVSRTVHQPAAGTPRSSPKRRPGWP